MVFNSRGGSDSSLSGFTPLEVLLALLLCVVPVVAVQSLMLRTADSLRLAAQQALAARAVTNTFERIYAFHIAGLWPQGVVAPGQWLDALNTDIAADESAPSALSCVNRWCSADQWAAYEATAIGCTLNADWEAAWCATVAQIPAQTQGAVDRPQVPLFRASVTANTALSLRVRWPKSQQLHQSADSGDWYQVTLGSWP